MKATNQQENSEAQTALDITSFDAVAESEIPQPLEMKDTNGNDTGVVFMVIGRHANAVTDHNKKVFNEMQRQATMAQRRGKEIEPKSIEELREANLKSVSVRVVDWKGKDPKNPIKQAFDKEILKNALARNPHWVDQVMEFSEDLGNFTKSS